MKSIKRLTMVLGVLFALYHMIMVFGVFQQSLEHYTNHLMGGVIISGLTAIIAILEQPSRSRRLRWLKLCLFGTLLVFGAIATGYIRFSIERLEFLATFLSTTDMIIGAMLLLAIVGFTWVVWGSIVAVVVSLAVLYFFFGDYIPAPFGHRGYDVNYVMSYLGMGLTAGIYKWIPLSADTMFLFMVLGALLNRTGVHRMFVEVGKAIGNWVRGGVAYPAVVGSALMGTVTGVSMGNVVLTGSVTIPMMKRAGFNPKDAAAIEVVASSGGQIMPPIMGVGAFILAAFLNMPYIDVAVRATLPALLFFVSVGIGVFFLTRVRGIHHSTMSVEWRLVRRLSPSFVIPFTILVLLLLWRYSPNYSAFWAILAIILMALTQGQYRPSLKEMLVGLGEGAIAGAQLAILATAAGALAQTVEITNFADVAYRLISLPFIGGSGMGALLLTMAFLVVLGTGMPTAIAYVIGAVTLAPALQRLGFEPLAIHFFIFYYAVFANNTPPVALNVSVAAKLANAPFLATAWLSIVLGAPAFFLPFAFIYNPALLQFPHLTWELIVPTLVTLFATVDLGAATFGFFIRQLGPLLRSLLASAVVVAIIYIARVEVIWLAAFVALNGIFLLSILVGRKRSSAKTALSDSVPESESRSDAEAMTLESN